MSDKKTFVDKLNSFLFGPPIPVLSERDLKALHRLDRKLDTLLNLLETQAPGGVSPRVGLSSDNGQPDLASLEELTEQVRKLAKTQFKANTLQETQLAQQQEVVGGLQRSLEQQEKRLTELTQQQQQAIEQAQLEVIKTLLPVIDSLETAFDLGRRQVLRLPMPATTRRAVIGWLDGIRLARLRLLDILKNYRVTPIPTIGEPFDPNRHVAVAADATARAADGLIVGEDRRGYTAPDRVLRFAEVVVARSANNKP
ncbi:MAG: nucleotide exchange factor GrpE [Chloroflexota bacterium]